MSKRIAYLGPPGTFTEEAALLHDEKGDHIPFPTVSAVAAAVEAGMSEEGVVAIENSIEGSVTDTLDVLIHESNLLIRRELILPIEHQLLAKPGARANEIEVIFSHPHALAQCRHFLERCFPKSHIVAALSTTAAVEEMLSSSPPAAAIGTRRAAALYQTEILAKNIQDQSSNLTRFVVIAPTDHPPTGCDKTSICFSFAEDCPGLLYGVIREFAQENINLTKIESRPSKEGLGKYIFLIDLEGHREDSTVDRVLEKAHSQASLFKVFGSYPRCSENK